MAEAETIITLENVYKIFGPNPRGRAFDLCSSGVSKDEVQRQTGHVVGMKDISFEVKKGEIFVVMGLSGSGKSTAIRTVNKLHDVTHGRVIVEGTDVQQLRGAALQSFRREKLAMVFQHFALFPHRNIIDNTAYGLKVQGVDKPKRQAAAIEALAMVGLEAYAFNSTRELSGGMQQRVALARCLANDPDVILMDEPLGALDALTREKMQSLVLKLWKETGKTIILITHSVEEALLLGERLLVMAPRPGRIHREYRLPFADLGVGHDLREVKKHPEFAERREEILGMIWDMEEEIMGRTEDA